MAGCEPIKVAGLGLAWGYEYAKTFSDKLHEMGFVAKPYEVGEDKYLVVYSHRDFTSAESTAALEDLFEN